MHDLFSQMKRLSQDMLHSYQDIQNRLAKTENTTVAGDLAVEAWVDMLKGLLPNHYKVFKNGTIISRDDHTSPEIDILVVKGEHPKHLLEQKVFLESGVAAAFECKLTLKARDIEKYLEACKEVKSLCPDRFGTPYKELHSPIIYGLLALSHPPNEHIVKKLNTYKSVDKLEWHPRDFIDLIAVADLNTWVVQKLIVYGTLGNIEANPLVSLSYSDISDDRELIEKPTYSMIHFSANLINMLAREDTSLRNMAEYYRSALSEPPGSNKFPQKRIDFSMTWDYTSVLSEYVCNVISTRNFEQETRIIDGSGGRAVDPYGEWIGVW